jgi:hypothetical protein
MSSAGLYGTYLLKIVILKKFAVSPALTVAWNTIRYLPYSKNWEINLETSVSQTIHLQKKGLTIIP